MFTILQDPTIVIPVYSINTTFGSIQPINIIKCNNSYYYKESKQEGCVCVCVCETPDQVFHSSTCPVSCNQEDMYGWCYAY